MNALKLLWTWDQCLLLICLLLFLPAVVCGAEVEHRMLRYPEAREGFEKYKAYDEGSDGFKVFLMTISGGWSFQPGFSYEEALKRARLGCVGWQAECRLFAIGDTIVWGMSKAEVDRVIAAYRVGKTAVQSPLPKLITHPAAIKVFREYQKIDDEELFQVFATDRGGAAGGYGGRTTYEAAVEAALEQCKKWSEVQSFASGGCRLLAVGNTIVWDIPEAEREKVIAAYRESRVKIVMPSELSRADAKILSAEGLAGFRKYINMDAYGKFKVFAAAPKGAWSYRTGASYDAAAKAALERCQFHAGSAISKSSKCRLFAVGDTVIWSMSKGESEKAIAAYRDAGPSDDPFLVSKEKAARQGSAQAKFELGNAYQRGWWGAEKNMTKAAMWYRMAAEQGHEEAQYWIGMMSTEGVGVAQDIVEGYMWLILAADAGFSSASTKRDEVGAALTHAQMFEAQRLAQGWKAKRN